MNRKTKETYRKLKIGKPVGKPSVPISEIRKAVRNVMKEDGMLPKKD